MGLSTKQDQGPDWSHASTGQSKPPSIRRQQQPETTLLKCPRCGSNNTKFCYYNNYNKTQPRHFCKSCKRHWTKGGTLRNVPVGGGRKNKRTKQVSKTTSSATTAAVCQQDDQKSMSKAIYETLIRSSSPILLHDQTTTTIGTASTVTSIPLMGSNNIINGENNAVMNSTVGHQNSPNTEFQFTSLSSSLDIDHMMNASCLLGTTNWYHHHLHSNFINVLDRESSVNINNIPSGAWDNLDHHHQQQQLPSSYWNWNETDVLASADHLNISWGDDHDDDAEIKP